jgi:carboxylesterase type B
LVPVVPGDHHIGVPEETDVIDVREATIVATRQGPVRGEVVNGIHVFRGVPFAAPPFGPNHLREPQPVEPWAGVRDAIAFGPKPPQPPFPGTELVPAPWDRSPAGEDCLNLIVWTPEPGAARLPVLVWITGGAFRVGSNAWYDGSRFARDGVVCVAINYRSGPEGFLWLPDGVANRGLLDQVAALRWVRDNIAAFGGDPDNVTVCGESAGAMCIGMLLAMPAAAGLFRRAILESGAAHQAVSAETATRVGQAFARQLGVAPALGAIAALAPEPILAAHAALDGELAAGPDPERWSPDVVASMMLTQPVVDGDVLPAPPIDRIREGSAASVDVLVGTNEDDWRLFLAFTGQLHQITEEQLAGPVNRHGYLSAAAYGLADAGALAAYRTRYPDRDAGELLAAIQTDWWCRIPAIRLADAHARGARGTWMYEFGWPSPAGGGLFGSCHALEIPFVFDTLDQGPEQMLGDLLGDAPPQSLATAMHAAWVSFASRGDPGWPAYEPGRRTTLRFDLEPTVVEDPRSWELELWQGRR